MVWPLLRYRRRIKTCRWFHGDILRNVYRRQAIISRRACSLSRIKAFAQLALRQARRVCAHRAAVEMGRGEILLIVNEISAPSSRRHISVMAYMKSRPRMRFWPQMPASFPP